MKRDNIDRGTEAGCHRISFDLRFASFVSGLLKFWLLLVATCPESVCPKEESL